MKPLYKYSLLAAGIIISFRLAVFFTESQLSTFGIYSGLLSLSLLFFPVWLAIRDKKALQGGYISLRQAVKAGLGIAIVSGIMVALFTILYFQFIDHDTVKMVQEKNREFMIKEKKTESEIVQAEENIRNFYSPFNQGFGVFTGVFISGLILSIICSTFLVKNPPEASA